MADEKVNMGPEENKPPETLSPPGQGDLPPLEENNAPAVSDEGNAAPDHVEPDSPSADKHTQQTVLPGMGEDTPAPSGKVINLSDIQTADKGGKEASTTAPEKKAPEADQPKKRRGRPPKEQAAVSAGKKEKAAEPRTGRPSKVDKAAREEAPPAVRDKAGLLTKCLIIYYERKKAIKKTPTGVIPCTLSSFLSSKRSPKGGSGPPLPLTPVARCVLSYAPTSERQTCPRTRSAACAAHPDSPARFAGRDAAALWDGSRCPAAFARRVYHFGSNISPGKDSSGSLRGLPNTPSTHRWRCGTAPSREALFHWGNGKCLSPHHKKRHPA